MASLENLEAQADRESRETCDTCGWHEPGAGGGACVNPNSKHNASYTAPAFSCGAYLDRKKYSYGIGETHHKLFKQSPEEKHEKLLRRRRAYNAAHREERNARNLARYYAKKALALANPPHGGADTQATQ